MSQNSQPNKRNNRRKHNPNGYVMETFPTPSRAWSVDWDDAAIRAAGTRRRRRVVRQ
jgi:hypothetical protein